MIFSAKVKKRSYFITLATIIFSLLLSYPVVANSVSWLKDNNAGFSTTIVANNFDAAKQRHPNLFQHLNLTNEQRQQIEQIHHQYRQQIQKRKQQIAKLQQQLSDMMVGTDPAQLLRAKNQQLTKLQQEIGTLRFESMLATREILTPPQREKFRELVNSRLTQD